MPVATDARSRAAATTPVDADQLAADDRGLCRAVIDDDGARVQVIMDADRRADAPAVAVEQRADGRRNDGFGGAAGRLASWRSFRDALGGWSLVHLQHLVTEGALTSDRASKRPSCIRVIDHDLPEVRRAEAIDERSIDLCETRLPRLQIAHLAHIRLQQLLQAAEAGLQRRVHRAAGDGDAEARRGEQRILFGVDADTDVIALTRWVLVPAGRSADSRRPAVRIFDGVPL